MRRRESEGAFARIRWRRSKEKGEEQAVDHSTCWRLGRCPSASSSMNRVTTAFVSSLSAKRKVSSVVFTRNAIDSTMVAIPSFSRLCFTSSVFSAHFESSASSSASNDPTEEPIRLSCMTRWRSCGQKPARRLFSSSTVIAVPMSLSATFSVSSCGNKRCDTAATSCSAVSFPMPSAAWEFPHTPTDD